MDQRDSEITKREINTERTLIPKGETGALTLAPPQDCAWKVAFAVARFSPRQQHKFEKGESIDGTMVHSSIILQKSAGDNTIPDE